MLVCCWISWVETRLRPSERTIASLSAAGILTDGNTSQVPYRAARRKFASHEHVRGHFRKRITSYRRFTLLNLYPQDVHTLILGRAITGIQAFT